MRELRWTVGDACAIEQLERRVLLVLYGPDISFGNGGVAAGPAGTDVLAELPGGKILAIGSRRIAVDQDFDLERDAHRLNPDGTIDSTFANGAGVISLGDSGDAILADARFYATVPAPGSGIRDIDRIIAYTTDGVIDTTFSGDGFTDVPSTLTVDETPDSVDGSFLAATPDGGVVLLVSADGFNEPRYEEIVKLKPDGTVDTTFGDGGGFLRVPPIASNVSVTWTSNGVLFYGTPNFNATGDITLTRYLPDGSGIDAAFGAGGTLVLPSWLWALAEQPDGKLLLIRSPDTDRAALTRRLYRLNADGSADTSFGQSGSVALSDASFSTEIAQFVLDNQQRILVVTGERLHRFSPAGARDEQPFDGSVRLAKSASTLGKLAVDSSGRVLLGHERSVTRFDVLQAVAIGRDDVLYVHGDDATDDTAIVNADGVNLNGTFTDIDTGAIGGVTLNLARGDNAATVLLDLPTTVNTGDGADTITTGNGNDRISADQGDNVIVIGDGNDVLDVTYGGASADRRPTDHHRVTGGDGDKDISIFDGRATIVIGTGNSKVDVSGHSNEIDVNDHITIAGGNNDVEMSGGNDVLEIGGNGNNTVWVLNNRRTATITTGDGNDFFRLSGGASVNSNGGDDSFAMAPGFPQDEPLLIFAGDGNDRVAVSHWSQDAVATIHGGNGNDYVQSGRGGQTIYGGAGNDTIWGGGGSDLISAGGGNDRVYAEGGADRVYGGAGRDRIYGGNHDDRLHGGANGDWLYGQHGNNQLRGEGGNDRLYADYAGPGELSDTLVGGAGDDYLVSRDSLADQLFGGRGDDAAVADENDEDVIAGVESIR